MRAAKTLCRDEAFTNGLFADRAVQNLFRLSIPFIRCLRSLLPKAWIFSAGLVGLLAIAEEPNTLPQPDPWNEHRQLLLSHVGSDATSAFASPSSRQTIPVLEAAVPQQIQDDAQIGETGSLTSFAPTSTPSVFSDRLQIGGDAPDMITLPGGEFLMGSTPAETGHVKNEAPQSKVRMQPFAISMFEVTEAEFSAYLRATKTERGGPCDVYESGAWKRKSDIANAPWLSSGREPAICVTWQQAGAYADWLSKQSGYVYRLPSEEEWEYAARAGTSTAYSFGNDPESGCEYMNGADRSAIVIYEKLIGVSCDDGFAALAPVGSLRPNAFGLHDMHGNVWEWTSDAWTTSHDPGAIPDETRVIRGGSWFSYPMWLRSANRNAWKPGLGRADVGFRVVREITARD